MSRRGWGCRPLPNGASSHSSWPYIQPPILHSKTCVLLHGGFEHGFFHLTLSDGRPRLTASWTGTLSTTVHSNPDALTWWPGGQVAGGTKKIFQPRCSHLFLSQQNLLLRPNLKLDQLTFQAKTGDCNLRCSQVTPGSLRGSQVFSPAQLADGKGRLILPWLQPVSLQMIRDVDGKSLPA